MIHLDYEILNSLKQVMEDDFNLLVTTFIQDSQDRIQKLRLLIQKKVIESTDADLIRRTAHSFKGSSSNIGAPHLSALCAALENKALTKNLDDLAQDLREIEEEFARVNILLGSL